MGRSVDKNLRTSIKVRSKELDIIKRLVGAMFDLALKLYEIQLTKVLQPENFQKQRKGSNNILGCSDERDPR